MFILSKKYNSFKKKRENAGTQGIDKNKTKF